MREQLFSYLDSYHIIQMPRINYLPEGYFSFYKNMGPYIINTHLLKKNKLKYYIGVKGYCNTICIEGHHNVIIVDNFDYAIINYDCSFMNKNQYLEKQYRWFNAYYKYFGTLDRFNITYEDISDTDRLFKFCLDRIKCVRSKHYEYIGYEMNPTIIKERILGLTNNLFGKHYFNIDKPTEHLNLYRTMSGKLKKK